MGKVGGCGLSLFSLVFDGVVTKLCSVILSFACFLFFRSMSGLYVFVPNSDPGGLGGGHGRYHESYRRNSCPFRGILVCCLSHVYVWGEYI